MLSFAGTHNVLIDAKYRINLPRKFVEVIDNKYNNILMLFKEDDCIVAYPQSEWLANEEKVLNFSSMKKDVRDFRRLFYSRVEECQLKHGRILIPPSLREYAGLNREIVLVGVSTTIEIWSKDRWDEFIAGNDNKFEELAEKLADM